MSKKASLPSLHQNPLALTGSLLRVRRGVYLLSCQRLQLGLSGPAWLSGHVWTHFGQERRHKVPHLIVAESSVGLVRNTFTVFAKVTSGFSLLAKSGRMKRSFVTAGGKSTLASSEVELVIPKWGM